MTNTVNNVTQDKQEIKYQLSSENPAIAPAAKLFSEIIEVKEVVTKLVSTQIAGSMVWGSDEFAVWGTDSWGDNSNGSFILNSSEFGLLGTNKLGANGSSEALYAVIPRNNIYIEYFGQDDYINTSNSTGTIDTSAETYTLETGEILESEIIAKLRAPITQVKLLDHAELSDNDEGMILPFTLGVDTFGDSNVSIEFSNDSGITWQSGNENELYIFSSTGASDELKYRITNVNAPTIVIDKPLFVEIN